MYGIVGLKNDGKLTVTVVTELKSLCDSLIGLT